MRRFNIYWIITIVAVSGITFWQVISVIELYQFEKEKFSNMVNDCMFLSVYNLNTLPCLGLFYVKSAIKAHSGTIWINDTKNKRN